MPPQDPTPPDNNQPHYGQTPVPGQTSRPNQFIQFGQTPAAPAAEPVAPPDNRMSAKAKRLAKMRYSVPVAIAIVFGSIGIGTLFSSSASTNAYSLWGDNVVPRALTVNDGQSTELGVKFTTKVAGQITAIRFYKSALNTGTHTGTLWTQSGQMLATVTFANESRAGWQEAALSKPVSVLANTVYIASYHAPQGHYSVNINYFRNSRMVNKLVALKNGTSGGNGLFIIDKNITFPTRSANGTNYWVDVVFLPVSKDSPAPTPPAPDPGTTPVTPPEPTTNPTPPTGPTPPVPNPVPQPTSPTPVTPPTPTSNPTPTPVPTPGTKR